MNNIFRAFYLIIFLLFIFSCKPNKMFYDKNNNYELIDIQKEICSINIKIDDIDFLDSDYQIINYSEERLSLSDNKIYIQKYLNIKITNSEKIMQIKELKTPIVYLNINGKNYSVKGNYYWASYFPNDCDFIFPIDGDGKIWFSENDSIGFIGGVEVIHFSQKKYPFHSKFPHLLLPFA